MSHGSTGVPRFQNVHSIFVQQHIQQLHGPTHLGMVNAAPLNTSWQVPGRGLPSVPFHRHSTQQDILTSPRLSEPAGGSPTPRGFEAPEASSGAVRARRGSGTQRANPGPLQRSVIVCLCPGDPPTSGHHWGPEAFCRSVSACRGSGTQRANPRAPAAQHHFSPASRGSGTQWATTGAPEAHCGMVVQEREGTSDKTGVGRTKDNGTATVQRKSPGTSRRRTCHPRQP